MAKLRNSVSSSDEADNLSGHLASWLHDLKVEDLFATCVTCRHLGVKGIGCKLYPGASVPAHVVIHGCEKYDDPREIKKADDDDIPF